MVFNEPDIGLRDFRVDRIRPVELKPDDEFPIPTCLRPFVVNAWWVGSRETAPSFGTGCDYDVLLLTGNYDGLLRAAEASGWENESIRYGHSGDGGLEAEFLSLRRDIAGCEVNLIATCFLDEAKFFLRASLAAKRLGLNTREERVQLFEAILYGVWQE